MRLGCQQPRDQFRSTTKTTRGVLTFSPLFCLRLRREAVVMVRKLGAIGATVFISSGSEQRVALKLTVLLGIFVGAMLLQTIFRPHSNRELFRLETLGLIGCSIMVYCACTMRFHSLPTMHEKGFPDNDARALPTDPDLRLIPPCAQARATSSTP